MGIGAGTTVGAEKGKVVGAGFGEADGAGIGNTEGTGEGINVGIGVGEPVSAQQRTPMLARPASQLGAVVSLVDPGAMEYPPVHSSLLHTGCWFKLQPVDFASLFSSSATVHSRAPMP